MLRAVLFDAVGTLIHLRAPVGETYARVARAADVSLSADALQAAFVQLLRAMPPMVFPERSAEQVRTDYRMADGLIGERGGPGPVVEVVPMPVEADLRGRSASAWHADADAKVGGQWIGWTGSLFVLTLLLATVATAGPTPAPTPSDRATATHSFADVPYWTTVFDDPKRDDWQKPRELVAALGLQPGQTVADLGAGTGYLSRDLAAAVGPAGSVLAVEVEPTLIAHLRERAERDGIDNLIPLLGSVDNPRLPARGVDLILILDTYHHLDHRHAYLPTLRAFLSPGGRVAVVDWRAGELPEGPPPDHKLPRQQVIDEMRAAGFALATEHEFLPYHYFLIFE